MVRCFILEIFLTLQHIDEQITHGTRLRGQEWSRGGCRGNLQGPRDLMEARKLSHE